MVKTGLAEWMLTRRFGNQRANEIYGDLLEQYKPRRVCWEMFRLALGIRGPELVGLLLMSFAMALIQHALFSAWPLRFMNNLQDAYVGWAWSMCSSLGLIALTSWLVTASSALRLGMTHKLTRCSLAFAVALSVLSSFMLQPELRRVSPVLVAAFLVWLLRASGLTATLSCLVATGFTVCSLWELFSTVRTREIHACVVNMHSRLQPTSFSFYSACSTWAMHVWLILFVGALLAFWLVSFLPYGSPWRASQISATEL